MSPRDGIIAAREGCATGGPGLGAEGGPGFDADHHRCNKHPVIGRQFGNIRPEMRSERGKGQVIVKRLGPDAMHDFLLRELDRVGLGHNTFTKPAVDLIVRSADGVLRKARNLALGCMIEAVRSGNRSIDIDNVNRVLMQPHWQKDADLVDY